MQEEHYCKYISSKGIAKSCDIQVFSQEDFDHMLKNTISCPVIYLHVNYIKLLKNTIDSIRFQFTLVSGCGDYTNPNDFFDSHDDFLHFIQNEKITRWFSQNCLIEHPKITKIPIGLDYHTLFDRYYYWGEQATPIEQENELIEVKNKTIPFWEREPKCYSNFHFIDYGNIFGYTRNDVIKTVPKELVYYEPTQIRRLETWINQSKYAYVISPFGHGLDCHRTWEALILGCIVIVKTSPLDCLYKDLPVLIVNEWYDINEELLKKTIVEFKETKFDYNKLTLEYYINEIKI
jgi:hypothetical protein